MLQHLVNVILSILTYYRPEMGKMVYKLKLSFVDFLANELKKTNSEKLAVKGFKIKISPYFFRILSDNVRMNLLSKTGLKWHINKV